MTMAVGAVFLYGFIASARPLIEGAEVPPGDIVLIVISACLALLFVGAGMSFLMAAVTRRLALRVDSSGVTLGRAFLPARPVFVPWRDIEQIVRFAAVNRSGTAQFIGVRLKPGATRPPGVPAQGSLAAKLRRLNAGFTPWPADLFRNARSWSLDDSSLAEAVRRHAGPVPIVWADTRGILG